MTVPQMPWTCSDFASSAGEPLIGSASRTDCWLLVEYPGPWERKALQASAIPQSVKDALSAIEKNVPHTRIELIKQDRSQNQDDIAFFVARSSPGDSSLYRFDLRTYEDILGLDLSAIMAGDNRYLANRVGAPVFIVCTNGRRDPCCARNGLPLFHVMADRAPGQVWECTHLGGHRFGPNVVALPVGLSYGRVKAADVAAVLDVEHILLENLRGRTCFDPPAQAAEIFLRQHTGSRIAASLSLAGMVETAPGRWAVTFKLGEQAHVVRVEQAPAGYGTYASCGDETPGDVLEFRLVDIT